MLALCHSGKGKSQLPDALADALAHQKAPPALETRSEASIVLTACAFGETAIESDELQHDVYTHFFLEGLARGDLDGDGAVTASEAHDWAGPLPAFCRGPCMVLPVPEREETQPQTWRPTASSA